MIQSVHVAAMGKLRIEGAEGLRQQQPLALLSYLAIDGAKTRDHLASVFWPQAKRPLNNLSSALSRIRDHLPEAIVVEQNVVACTLDADVTALRRAIASLDTESITRLYQGPFFESSTLRMGLELEEWVWAAREVLARTASTALIAAAEQRSGDEAVDLATQAYGIGKMYWVDASLWQRCYEVLAGNAGLAEQVRVAAAQQGYELDVSVPAPSAAVQPTDEIFGRSAELAVLDAFHTSRQLNSPPEWMAIVGMGGVGKTALAKAWLARLENGDDRTAGYFVELADLHSAEQLAASTADALGIPYSTDAAFLEALQRRCSADRPVALVLDNLEQVDGYAPFLQALAAIDGLTAVVSTRAASGVADERTLELAGLIDDRASAGRAMFIAKALPACPEVAEHPELVQQACVLLDGHPLAIELFTAWLRTIPLRVAVDSLGDSNELVNNLADQSLEPIDALLDRSWMLLDGAQARLLGRLCLFEGPFDFADALATADTTLVAISDLMNSSLLNRRDDKLILHPLVRTYAQAKMRSTDPDGAAEAERRFVNHYVAHVLRAAIALRGPDAGQASQTLAQVFGSVQTAWRLALKAGQWQAVGDMADGIAAHLKARSQLYLTTQLFGEALECLSTAAAGVPSDAVLVRSHVAVGWRLALTQLVQGDRTAATEVIERCTLLCDRNDRSGQMGLAYVRGQIESFAGRYEEAREHFAVARSLADDSSQAWFVAEVETASAVAAMSLEQLDEARRLTRSVLETGRRLDSPVIVSDAYYCLGTLDFEEDPAAALVLLNQALAVAEAASLTQKSRKYATVIGRCHIELGDADAAKAVFEQALRESDDEAAAYGEPWVRVANLSGLAMALALTGDQQQANQLFSDAVRSVIELDDWPLMLETALEICRLRTDKSASPTWRGLLHVVSSHEAALWEWQAEANELLGAADCAPAPGDVLNLTDESLGRVAERALLLLQS